MLKKFYQSKVEEIRLKYENVCNFIEHNGEKGNENELILIDFLKDFLPKSYSIGRGFIIDSEGNTSNQCDIVIYDNFHNPNLIKLSSNTYFPVESVYCVIEVKTTVREQDMKKSFEDSEKIKGLSFKEENTAFTRGGMLLWAKTNRPNYFLFAYQADTNICKTFMDRFKKYPTEICFILNMGILRTVIEPEDKDKKIKALFEVSCIMDLVLTPEKEKELLEKVNQGDKFFDLNCIKYPILKRDKDIFLVDYIKNFLVFLFLLNNSISNKQIGKNYLQHYFPLDKIISIKEDL